MKLVVLKTKIIKFVTGLALTLSVTACASTDNVTRNHLIQAAPLSIELAQPAYKVEKLSVTIPGELTVSEANLFMPIADIVWREDPRGNRKLQVQAILIDAISKGVSKVAEGRAVTMEVRLNKFHAITEKARYTIGGRHNINFDYILRDAQTGIPVADMQNVNMKFKAYGGSKAFAAIARGETQKVRITQHIEDHIYQRMSANPES